MAAIEDIGTALPTADQIALALVTAARLRREDPVAIAKGARSRARFVAIAALKEAFPQAGWPFLGRCCGHHAPGGAQGRVIMARTLKWWREIDVDEVVGVLLTGGEADEQGAEQPMIEPTPFSADERRLISRMWKGGASPVSIGAALGSDADTVRRFASDNPGLCPAAHRSS
ncbi:hypothetical protein [Nitratireductor luteus]|uniref:hypothetical protein n=1 Tax=Nitratireductor luteus TaxID=2976980 RepID=UPI00223ED60D|nr:hypothetical protein [Nitratireductor luteus]